MELNVLGGMLEDCCHDPLTGYYRDGSCRSGADDQGSHTVCARVNNEFLHFSKQSGNDLSTPRPEYNFPGLKDGDQWCVVAVRWLQAVNAGYACPIVLSSTNQKCLEFIPLELLMQHANDLTS
jgi:uncharacterized protein (DUF2237 family)